VNIRGGIMEEKKKEVNRNFIKTDGKTALRKMFEKKKYTVKAYARACGVKSHSILSEILNGNFDGSKGHRSGSTRRLIAELKKDGVWIGTLPWEN
jgi:hypothetical protein